MKTVRKTSYRRLPGNRAVEATVVSKQGKKKNIIKTAYKQTDYGNQQLSASGYKTKTKYDRSGGVKKTKTKKMGMYKTLGL